MSYVTEPLNSSHNRKTFTYGKYFFEFYSLADKN